MLFIGENTGRGCLINMLNFSDPHSFFFMVFAGITIGSALLVVLHKNPVASAVFLVLSFFGLAGIYALMNAVFIATMQILVYAGAIMVLVVFVLMLLNLNEETHQEIWNKPVKKTVIVLIVISFAFLLVTSLSFARKGDKSEEIQKDSAKYEYIIKEGDDKVTVHGNTASVSASTFIEYLLPFEIISILLLVAVIGAVIIAKKDFKT